MTTSSLAEGAPFDAITALLRPKYSFSGFVDRIYALDNMTVQRDNNKGERDG